MARRKREKNTDEEKDFSSFRDEICAWISIVVAAFIFLGNFGICGVVGTGIAKLFFGIFGFVEYIVPLVVLFFALLLISNQFSSLAVKKTIIGIVLLCMFSVIAQMVYNIEATNVIEIFFEGFDHQRGGGLIGGCILVVSRMIGGKAGAILFTGLVTLVCLMLISGKSVFGIIKQVFQPKVSGTRREKVNNRRKRSNRKRPDGKSDEEVEKELLDSFVEMDEETMEQILSSIEEPMEEDPVIPTRMDDRRYVEELPEEDYGFEEAYEEPLEEAFEEVFEEPEEEMVMEEEPDPEPEIVIEPKAAKPVKSDYKFPPIDLLQKGKETKENRKDELKENAVRLQQTLKNFGVNVTITNISSGPTVTRYEIQPEQGVKVSKILGLTDDIKLNLAAADIRIEAPIPGKAAIGIEVPNSKNQVVTFRELIDSPEFRKFPSKICFAAGKDLSGKTIISDIESMPHLLIAGATGSGKSVCINTIIMSILYKSDPKDVKMILIDPKVVELSVYKDIPHLLIPVVTDPKQAAGALNWAVMEMTDRYNKFSEVQARNLKAYNQKVEDMKKEGLEGSDFQKLPQIIVVIDELADLMMVASHDVEAAIVRLTQLARAAGIHLIIATQRPSVNVITGLIKANVPSRIAFAVSSGVDSRTIIDMNGAERLLGKGDMLFYPYGYKKPIRVQGAFVSDQEVAKVVEYVKTQNSGEDPYQPDVKKVMEASALKLNGGTEDANGRDEYFYDAASFIIDKDKASIASLQRVFKIGFNRASRLMEQLCEAGVVGEEEGTKPRKVIMSQEEFERLKEEEM